VHTPCVWHRGDLESSNSCHRVQVQTFVEREIMAALARELSVESSPRLLGIVTFEVGRSLYKAVHASECC
jgi:hypothetical protein